MPFGQMHRNVFWKLCPVLIFFVGAFLRLFLYPEIPPGLNQDEAASGYEAYSLLTTGRDQWGNPYPVHFPGWGAGQSVLYSYLTMPAVKYFGLKVAATRSTGLIFGLLTLPLIYWLASAVFDRQTGLLSMLLVAVTPWHVMMSRWGLDANLLPVFLLLGCCTFHLATSGAARKVYVWFALVPFALALYAYGLALLVVPFLVAVLLFTRRAAILQNLFAWVGSIAMFMVLAAPLLLYVLKDYFLKRPLWGETLLPFTIPQLPAQRLTQVTAGLFDNLTSNAMFVLKGFDDGLIWNTYPPFLPLFLIPLPVLCLGVYFLARRGRAALDNIFLLWLVSCIPLLFAIAINVNRGNALFLPIIVLSAFGLREAILRISTERWQSLAVAALSLWIIGGSTVFAARYFSNYAETAASNFRAGLGDALNQAKELTGQDEPILVTDKIPLDYMNVLYLQNVPPSFFHQNVEVSIDRRGLYDVHKVGRFYFNDAILARDIEPDGSYTYVLRSDEDVPCQAQPRYRSAFWTVGRCPAAVLRPSP